MYQSLNSVQRDVMIQCLILANHEPNKWEWKGQIFTCHPGQFVTSLESLKKHCANGTTTKMIRTALLKLEKWEFLANDGAKTGRVITVINWHTYQAHEDTEGKESGRIGAGCGQDRGRIGATNKKLRSKEVKEKDIYGEFENVLLTKDEYNKLEKKFDGTCKEKIENLSQYIENFPAKGKKYKSHYSTILTWARKEGGESWLVLPSSKN